ncbi:MAG: hypothetical protein ABIA63_13910 [bacterium]
MKQEKCISGEVGKHTGTGISHIPGAPAADNLNVMTAGTRQVIFNIRFPTT